ncbi:thioredoxin domain-containing protein [Neorickettsia sp. 179522]|uniref:thioredoxin domain-containing protein n=1 Tax=Neorickettsia sp. 179522 TaxID=1714371 RepID=UPI000ABC60FD|nr:thioredoxin domain-containing protein [Neorickettsia sp. 179522]
MSYSHKWLLCGLVTLLSFSLAFSAPLSLYPDALKFNPTTLKVSENLLFPGDLPIGSTDAPITIVDYSSFSCTHCKAAFEKLILPVYEKYGRTGKVMLIMRDFPLDKLSFNASVFLMCYRKNTMPNDEHVISLIRKLFDVGNNAKNKEDADKMFDSIISDANLHGSAKEKFLSCTEDLGVKDEVLYSKLFGIKKVGIEGTPVLFINGERYTGPLKFSSFEKKIEKILNDKRTIEG